MNSYWKVVILFIGANLGSMNFFGQSSQNNLKKYWYYRERLKRHFLIIGDFPGGSLPLTTIYQTSKYADESSTTIVDEGWLDVWSGVKGTAAFSDSPLELGYYLAVLATEYRLLKNNGRTDELKGTIQEIYYALKAFIRLDANAETLSPWNNPSIISPNTFPFDSYHNGFMVRDDAPFDFPSVYLEDYEETVWDRLNQKSLTPIYPFTDIKLNTIETELSWSERNEAFLNAGGLTPEQKADALENYRKNVLNVDVAVYSLFGLKLLSECFGDDVVDVELLDGTVENDVNFSSQAKEQMRKIITYLMVPIPLGSGGLMWQIYNPDGSTGTRGGQNGYSWGEPFLFLLAEATDNPFVFEDLLPGQHGIWLMQRTLSMASGQSAWNNAKQVQMLAALTNSWRNTDKTAKWIKKIDQHHGWFPFNNMLHYFLHSGSMNEKKRDELFESIIDVAKSSLNEAPCIGPHDFMAGENKTGNVGQWNSQHRWARPGCDIYNTEGNQDNCDVGRNGAYPGLGYMLLHNLYYLISEEELPVYRNMSVSRLSGVVSSITSDLQKFHGLYEVHSSQSVFAASSVEYRAGEQVHFTAGFTAQNGTNIHAYTEPFVCESDNHLRIGENGDKTVHKFQPKPGFIATDYSRIDESEEELSESELDALTRKEIKIDFSLELFPNPTLDGRLSISGGSVHSIVVYDINNRVVKSENLNEMEIDLSELTKGIYIIRLSSLYGEECFQKIVIQ